MADQTTPESRTVVARGPDAQGFFRGTGRRKTAVARVRLRAGSGRFTVNGKPLEVFFTEERDLNTINGVLGNTNTKGTVDVDVSTNGGGFTGQAGSVILGLGRALLSFDPGLEPILREHGYLTRDDRKVERKKYGQAGARRRFQFSKR
jgi:small subunit ribosomal protein S9